MSQNAFLKKLKLFYFFIYFFFYFCVSLHDTSSFIPSQGLNLCTLYWKHWVLTTGLPGKGQDASIFIKKKQKTRVNNSI